MWKGRTCSTLLDLLHCDREDIEYLNHYLHNYLRQFGVEKASRINLEALEEVVHALKEIEEHIMARTHIPCRLPNLSFKTCTDKGTARYGPQGERQCQ
jgi:hypothetical protein